MQVRTFAGCTRGTTGERNGMHFLCHPSLPCIPRPAGAGGATTAVRARRPGRLVDHQVGTATAGQAERVGDPPGGRRSACPPPCPPPPLVCPCPPHMTSGDGARVRGRTSTAPAATPWRPVGSARPATRPAPPGHIRARWHRSGPRERRPSRAPFATPATPRPAIRSAFPD